MRTLFHRRWLGALPLTLVSLVGWAQTDQKAMPVQTPKPVVAVKHLMPAAVQVKITPRGLTYFEKNLSTILGNIGVSLEEGYFEGFKWEAQKPIKLEELDLPPDTRDLVGKVRSLLTDWFIGFPLKDIRPGIEIGSSGYTAVFNRFALVADEALLNQLGKRDGAVLAIELEIKELNIGLSRVRAYDLGAPMLGQVGLDQASVKVGGGQTPIKLRVPFYIRMNEKEQLEFQALNIQENIRETNIEVKYKKLVAPTIVLEINGYRMEFSQDKLERELMANMPMILQKTRGFLSEFATKQLPALLNEKAREFLKGSLEEVNRLEPPGAEPGTPVEPLLWGLQLEKISQGNGLGIQLKAFVEDPKNPNSALRPELGSRGPVRLNGLTPDQYDIGMSIDRAMTNRILQLSFERRLFEKISVGPEGYMKLTETPTVDYVAAPPGAPLYRGEAFMKVRVKARVPPGSVTGFNKLFLKDNFEIAFDLIAKMRKIPYKGGIEIVLFDIDPNSVWLNPNDLTTAGSVFPGKVKSGVVDKLKTIAAGWKTKEEKLPGNLPLPPEVLGIKLEIDHMVLDPNGHLVMYLKYKERQQ